MICHDIILLLLNPESSILPIEEIMVSSTTKILSKDFFLTSNFIFFYKEGFRFNSFTTM